MVVKCESGCVRPGVHLVSCADEDCRGCEPELASVGVLCGRCWGRLQSAVRTLPSLVESLVEGEGSVSTEGVRVEAGPRSLYPPRLADADEIAAVFAEWVSWVGEVAGVAVPEVEGLWWSRPSVKVDGQTGERYVVDAQPVGVRSPRAVRRLAVWVDPLLEVAAAQSWAPEMIEELSRLEARAQARWGGEEPERRVREIACPKCGAHSLVVHPPRVVGADLQVTCSRTACGAVLSSEDWDHLRRWSVVVARLGGA